MTEGAQTEVWIGLGSNLGESAHQLQAALNHLRSAIAWTAVSPVYESRPMYVTDQPNFLNAVAKGTTHLGPLALLSSLKKTEQELGRVVRYSNGPREIDLDLLAYGSLQFVAGNRLIIPHPRIAERRFVLAPWADLDPEWLVTGAGCVQDLLAQTKDAPESVWVSADAVLFV